MNFSAVYYFSYGEARDDGKYKSYAFNLVCSGDIDKIIKAFLWVISNNPCMQEAEGFNEIINNLEGEWEEKDYTLVENTLQYSNGNGAIFIRNNDDIDCLFDDVCHSMRYEPSRISTEDSVFSERKPGWILQIYGHNDGTLIDEDHVQFIHLGKIEDNLDAIAAAKKHLPSYAFPKVLNNTVQDEGFQAEFYFNIPPDKAKDPDLCDIASLEYWNYKDYDNREFLSEFIQ